MRTLETEDTLASRYGRGKSTISTVHPVPCRAHRYDWFHSSDSVSDIFRPRSC